MKKKILICTTLSLCFILGIFLVIKFKLDSINFDCYSTYDIQSYDNLKEDNNYYFRIFPDKISDKAVNSFAFKRFEYFGHNVDVLLKSVYDDAEAFTDDLNSSLNLIKGKYRFEEIENQFIDGYINIYVGVLKEFPANNFDTHLSFIDDKEYYYQWSMLSYSVKEKVIIYNHAFVDSRDCKKYEIIPNYTQFTNYNFQPNNQFFLK